MSRGGVADPSGSFSSEALDLVARPYAGQSTQCEVNFGPWKSRLAEILPMTAVVEQLYPGRFLYAVAAHGGSPYGDAVRQSLLIALL
jgi:hypothetical protein